MSEISARSGEDLVTSRYKQRRYIDAEHRGSSGYLACGDGAPRRSSRDSRMLRQEAEDE